MNIFQEVFYVSKQAAEEGFDWRSWREAYSKVEEELEEVCDEVNHQEEISRDRLTEEFGDLIVAVMTLARHLNVDPEEACQVGIKKFQGRVNGYKEFLASKGMNLRTSQYEDLLDMWNEYKASLTRNGAIGED